jgi:hypothetical protein
MKLCGGADAYRYIRLPTSQGFRQDSYQPGKNSGLVHSGTFLLHQGFWMFRSSACLTKVSNILIGVMRGSTSNCARQESVKN